MSFSTLLEDYRRALAQLQVRLGTGAGSVVIQHLEADVAAARARIIQAVDLRCPHCGAVLAEPSKEIT